MKKFFRLILFMAALLLGGWLGVILLADFEPINTFAFFAVCGVLGLVFHKVDTSIQETENEL